MDPFSPSDQPLPSNDNGQSANGLGRNGLSRNNPVRNDWSNSDTPYRPNYGQEEPGVAPLAGRDGDAPELIPVFEDQGERFDKARNSAMKVYLVLILVGVIIGAITLFGIVLLLQHFGLTDVPVPVEQK